MGRIVFEVPLGSQDVLTYGLLACSFACFIEDVEGAVISPLTTAQRFGLDFASLQYSRELLSVPDTVLENYMLQIRAKDRQTISEAVQPSTAPTNRRNSKIDLDIEDDYHMISSSDDTYANTPDFPGIDPGTERSGITSSYFILNENHIRKLFQVC